MNGTSFTSQMLDVAKAAQTGDIDVTLAAIEKFRKAQSIRLFDVWVFGPLTMYWAWKGRLSKFERFVLFVMGAGTIGYNLRNYQMNKMLGLQDAAQQFITDQGGVIPPGAPAQSDAPLVGEQSPGFAPEVIDESNINLQMGNY